MIQPSTLQFLKNLKKHNEKTWFESNRKVYETAKKDFEDFVARILTRMKKSDASIAHLQPKDCTFRINRDVRFSKDKTPYKTNFGMYITRDGKKGNAPGYYFQCQPGNSFVAGGLWQPMKEELGKLRQEIDYNWPAFQKLMADKKFKAGFGDLRRTKEELLTRPPKGYDNENPAIDYLRLKSFVAYKSVTDEDLVSGDLVKKVTDGFGLLRPVVDFIAEALAD
jgi:uncharacterized protein (TIGR02453 family)